MTDFKIHPASFRDPAGFVFEHGGKYYRQVNQAYSKNYQLLKDSRLYEALASEHKLLPHSESDVNYTGSTDWYVTLVPEQLSFISYPYEWCFGQWKSAALLTLELVKKSIDHGMILKDATPFNIQFSNCRPMLIDSLSFEEYDETKPWVAYRQFAECFLAPLLFANYYTPELLRIFQVYPEGIPLTIAAKLLPLKSRLKLNVLLHIFLPARISGLVSSEPSNKTLFTKAKLLRIIDNLESFVQSLKASRHPTVWNNYYEKKVLSTEYVEEKKKIIKEWTRKIFANTILDIGTNTGIFAQTMAEEGKFTIAVDSDIVCIDKLYKECIDRNVKHLLPLCLDITNPTPAIGWENKERTSFLRRARADLTLALALIHHLFISKNIGFDQMVDVFSSFSPFLIIEFIPKEDPKVVLLLKDRKGIFNNYQEDSFLKAFGRRYSVLNRIVLTQTGRILFLMKRTEVINLD